MTATRPPARTAPAQHVDDVMTHAVVCAHEGAALKEIAAAFARNHISTVPVVDAARRVIGVVTASDLLTRISGDHGIPPRGHRFAARRENRRKERATVAAELMTAPAVTTTADATIAEAAHLAAHHHVRCMPVVDAAGVLVGMVSRSDLIKTYLRDDADIAADVENHAVQHVMLLDPAAVQVSVTAGIVTLAGCLDRRQQTDQLAECTRNIAGVIDVTNALTYRADDLLSDYGQRHV
jgi:CBS domain-containing protein